MAASRRIEYKESANIEGILNQTLIVPNIAALSGCSYAADSFFMRNSFNTLLIMYGASPVINTTIYNYLFNLSDPILELTQSIVPFLVPTTDTGVFQNVSVTLVHGWRCQIGLWLGTLAQMLRHDATIKQ